MQEYEQKIRELLEGVIAREGMELIHVECLAMKTRWLVRLFLDKNDGITINNCSFISGIAGDILGVHNIPPGAYTLEVSSPGPNRPISRPADFKRFIGAEVAIKMSEKLNGKKNIRGKIQEITIDGGFVLLSTPEGVYEIPITKISRANLLDESGKDG